MECHIIMLRIGCACACAPYSLIYLAAAAYSGIAIGSKRSSTLVLFSRVVYFLQYKRGWRRVL